MAQYPPGALHWGPSPLPGESVGENVAGELAGKLFSRLRCPVVRTYVPWPAGPRRSLPCGPGGWEMGTGKGRADVPAGFNRSEVSLDVLKTHLAFQQRVRGCTRNRQWEQQPRASPAMHQAGHAQRRGTLPG